MKRLLLHVAAPILAWAVLLVWAGYHEDGGIGVLAVAAVAGFAVGWYFGWAVARLGFALWLRSRWGRRWEARRRNDFDFIAFRWTEDP